MKTSLFSFCRCFSTLAMLSLVFTAALSAPVHAETEQEFRKFTSKDGRVVEAKVVSLEADSVVIERRDGKSFTLRRDQLHEEDQKYLSARKPDTGEAGVKKPGTAGPAAAAEKPVRLEIGVTNNKSNRVSKGEQFDDRIERVSLTVTITNKENIRKLEGAKATILGFAQNVNSRKQIGVLFREEWDVSIDPLAFNRHRTTEVENLYDNKADATFGFKYMGYVMILHDKDGKLIGSRTMPAGLAKPEQFESVLKLKSRQICSRDFIPVKGRDEND